MKTPEEQAIALVQQSTEIHAAYTEAAADASRVYDETLATAQQQRDAGLAQLAARSIQVLADVFKLDERPPRTPRRPRAIKAPTLATASTITTITAGTVAESELRETRLLALTVPALKAKIKATEWYDLPSLALLLAAERGGQNRPAYLVTIEGLASHFATG